MALHFDLKVNGKTIGQFSAVRQSENRHNLNRYLVTIKREQQINEFFVWHSYNDGAWELISKAMNMLSDIDDRCATGSFEALNDIHDAVLEQDA